MAPARATSGFFHELRRRRVFRTAGYYVVAAWLLLQAAEVLFPGFGIPEAAIRTVFWAAVVGFPVALVFGWYFDIGPDGIRRTPPASELDESLPAGLTGRDWIVLAALAAVFGVIVLGATRDVIEAPSEVVETTAEPAAPAAPAPLEKLDNSIAVLPFDNLSSDPENAYFADGIADEILSTLGRYSGLNVIGRTSSFAFRFDRPPAPRISDLLGARFLLQGSVRKSGTTVRISTQLLDERGVQVWSDIFDRGLDDAFAIQSEIAETVALTVAPRIAPTASREHIPDPVAYDHFLRGREAFYRRDRPAAIKAFEAAIEADPDFAAAHTELAASLAVGVLVPENLERARYHIDRAHSLTPGDARVLAVEGLLLDTISPPDLDGAERALRDALAREPNMLDALNWLAGVLREKGDDEAADAVNQRGIRLDPLHPALAANHARRLVARGQPGEAERRLSRLLGVPGIGRFPYGGLMLLYREQGRLADRYAIGSRMLRDTQPDVHYMLAETEILLGRWERARYWYRVDAGYVDDADYIDFRKPFFAHLETGLHTIEGRFQEAYTRLQRDPVFREDRFAGQSPALRMWLGIIPGLAGDCETTLDVLGPLLFPEGPESLVVAFYDYRDWQNAIHAIAWCLRQLDQPDTSSAVLERLERHLVEQIEDVANPGSDVHFFFARNAAMMGDVDLALERFETAIEEGWRSLNYHAREPFWSNLRADPRAGPLLTRVQADIAAERAKAEAMDADWDPIEWHRRSSAARDSSDLP